MYQITQICPKAILFCSHWITARALCSVAGWVSFWIIHTGFICIFSLNNMHTVQSYILARGKLYNPSWTGCMLHFTEASLWVVLIQCCHYFYYPFRANRLTVALCIRQVVIRCRVFIAWFFCRESLGSCYGQVIVYAKVCSK